MRCTPATGLTTATHTLHSNELLHAPSSRVAIRTPVALFVRRLPLRICVYVPVLCIPSDPSPNRETSQKRGVARPSPPPRAPQRRLSGLPQPPSPFSYGQRNYFFLYAKTRERCPESRCKLCFPVHESSHQHALLFLVDRSLHENKTKSTKSSILSRNAFAHTQKRARDRASTARRGGVVHNRKRAWRQSSRFLTHRRVEKKARTTKPEVTPGVPGPRLDSRSSRFRESGDGGDSCNGGRRGVWRLSSEHPLRPPCTLTGCEEVCGASGPPAF